MQKRQFMTLNSRLKNIYGLPTLLGLFLAGLLFIALWFSTFNDSSPERLLFTAMLLVGVIHLVEGSYTIRILDVKTGDFPPPFLNEKTLIPFEIKNISSVPSSSYWLKLGRFSNFGILEIFSKKGAEIEQPTLPATSTTLVEFPFTFSLGGIQQAPPLRIKTYTNAGLFFFWKYVEYAEKDKEIIVLPVPRDHGVSGKTYVPSPTESHELYGLEEIHDPSRFKFTDPKLFQKTNRRYQRVFKQPVIPITTSYTWESLEGLTHDQKGEQFSFWLKNISTSLEQVEIKAPFIEVTSGVQAPSLTDIKLAFGRWFYANS
jgi:hypothetical protein